MLKACPEVEGLSVLLLLLFMNSFKEEVKEELPEMHTAQPLKER